MSISIPVWQIIATALLLYLLPPLESVEKVLLSILKYKESVLAVKALLLAIIVLVPFYLHQKTKQPISKVKQKQLLSAIKSKTESEYELHRNNVLAKNFRNTVNKEASRGFNLPPGSLNGAIIDLYKNELSIFSNILENSINSATSEININGLHTPLSTLIIDMMNNQKAQIKADYKRVVDGYWKGKIGDFDLNAHFAKVADHETKLQIKRLLSINNLNKSIT